MSPKTKSGPSKSTPTKKSAKGASLDATPRRAGHANGSKLDMIVAALRPAKGASLTTLMSLTGWQQHSVRGAIAGALKKGRGLSITSIKVGDERVYKLDAKK
jgi:hypothetical protein